MSRQSCLGVSNHKSLKVSIVGRGEDAQLYLFRDTPGRSPRDLQMQRQKADG